MRAFAAKDHWELKGRGRVYSFDGAQVPHDLYDPCQLKGQTVVIDGIPREVVGVETYAIPRSPESPYRSSFGLLVR